MNKFHRVLLAAIALLFAGCTTPRTTSQSERDTAYAIVTTFETALVAAVAAGEVKPEKAQLAYADIAEIRKLIADSETVSVGWADLYQRVLNLGLKWAIAAK